MDPNNSTTESSIIATVQAKAQAIEVKTKKVEQFIKTIEEWSEVRQNLKELIEQLDAHARAVSDTLMYVQKVERDFSSKRLEYLELIRQEIENVRPLIRGPTSLTIAECGDLEVKLKQLADKLDETNTEGDDGLRQVKNDLDHELARLEDDLEHMTGRAHHNEGRTGRAQNQ